MNAELTALARYVDALAFMAACCFLWWRALDEVRSAARITPLAVAIAGFLVFALGGLLSKTYFFMAWSLRADGAHGLADWYRDHASVTLAFSGLLVAGMATTGGALLWPHIRWRALPAAGLSATLACLSGAWASGLIGG